MNGADPTKQATDVHEVCGTGLGSIAMSYNEHGDSSDSDSESLPLQKKACISVAQSLTASAVLGIDQKMNQVLQTGSELIPVLCLQGHREACHALPTSTDQSHMLNSNGQIIESNGAVPQKNLDIVLHTNPGNRVHGGIECHGEIVPISKHHNHGDISRGKERVSISLVSDSSNEDVLRDFYYIHQSIVYKNAHTDFSLANIGEYDCCRYCTGNCLESPLPCACACARVNCGEYAYTTYGCLRGSLIEQELGRKQQNSKSPSCGIQPSERCFIKECWEKCGCTQQCGNRVVQRGIFHRLQVLYNFPILDSCRL